MYWFDMPIGVKNNLSSVVPPCLITLKTYKRLSCELYYINKKIIIFNIIFILLFFYIFKYLNNKRIMLWDFDLDLKTNR